MVGMEVVGVDMEAVGADMEAVSMVCPLSQCIILMAGTLTLHP